MSKSIRFNLPSFLLLSLLLCLSSAQAKSPVASPQATTELICHTQHASECYPAIFQPTEHFQMIHDDQSIPPGLHVRMNLATGLKEARLNIPEPEDAPKADIVIVDNTPIRLAADEEAEAEPITSPGIQDQSQPERDYDYLPPSLDPEEASFFASEVSNICSSSIPTLETLSALTDLVHSYDWGLALTQNGLLITRLLDIFRPDTQRDVPDAPIEIRSAVALLLGTAVQNNPEALAALLSQTQPAEYGFPEYGVLFAIAGSLLISLDQTDPFTQTQLRQVSPVSLLQLHQRTVFLLHQIASIPAELRKFMTVGSGSRPLLEFFTFCNVDPHDTNAPFDPSRTSPGGGAEGRDKLRQRIANFMLDHVLPLLGSEKGLRYISEYEHTKEVYYAQRIQGVVNEWRRFLEQWDDAFGAALREYAIIMSEKGESEVPTVYKAHESISEARLLLKKTLEGGLYDLNVVIDQN